MFLFLLNIFKILLFNFYLVMKDFEKEVIVFSVRFIFRKKFLYIVNCVLCEIYVKKVFYEFIWSFMWSLYEIYVKWNWCKFLYVK